MKTEFLLTKLCSVMRSCTSIVLAFLMVALWTPQARAQGSCSAPQAGPGSVQGQGVGSLAPGQGWVQASLFWLDTRNRFDQTGAPEVYFNEGHLNLRSFLMTGAVGLVGGLEVWGQLSAHALDFQEISGSRARTGLGDARFWLRAGPRLLGVDESKLPVWLGLRAGVKLPGSDYPIDVLLIPLTEGQRDAELALEVARGFAHGKYVLQGWGGRRWRAENTEAARRPGNEWFGYLSGSVAVGQARVRLAAQMLRGSPYETLGVTVTTSRREMFELFPSVSTVFGPGQVEIGARLPVAGRNLPSGNAITLSYTLPWGSAPGVDIEDLLRRN
jgi:hypothetical protein